MYTPSLLLHFISVTSGCIRAIDSENNRYWEFKRNSNTQWLLFQEQYSVAIINISRLQSSIFWYENCQWTTALRVKSLAYEQLHYRISARHKLRWTRDGMSMELIDGSLICCNKANIQNFHWKQNFCVDGFVKICSGVMELHIMVSAFICLYIWSKPDTLARLRNNFSEKSRVMNKNLWDRLLHCIDTNEKSKQLTAKI